MQIETILAWVAAGAPKGDLKDMPPAEEWPDETESWQLATKYGEPDLVVKSPDYTMPAVAQDAWFRPNTPTGLTEPRWVRAIEIRPSSVKAPQDHASRARVPAPESEDTSPRKFASDPNVAGDGLFMEWAVGKYGDEMRPTPAG